MFSCNKMIQTFFDVLGTFGMSLTIPAYSLQVFLQADASLSIEPLYPQLCQVIDLIIGTCCLDYFIGWIQVPAWVIKHLMECTRAQTRHELFGMLELLIGALFSS
jgi:hypothetical protein